MKLIRKILISLGLAFFAGAVGALLLFGLPFTGWKALTVPTGSMRPTIPPGSLVLMHRVPLTSLKVGDVITYTNLAKPGTTITHRIIKTYKIGGTVPAFITKGDANPSPDAPVVGGQVLGRAAAHLPHLGAWVSFIKKPYVLLPMVYIPALAIIYEEIKRLNQYYKEQRPYTAPGFERPKEAKGIMTKMATSMKLGVAIVVVMSAVAVPAAHALLRSNTVSLAPNRLTVVKVIPPPVCTTNSSNVTITGSGNSNTTNNVNVSNTNNQSSSTGNATSNGGGTATTGNSTNTNCTTITVTIH